MRFDPVTKARRARFLLTKQDLSVTQAVGQIMINIMNEKLKHAEGRSILLIWANIYVVFGQNELVIYFFNIITFFFLNMY